MRVLFIYRNPAMGFSIGRVFATIEAHMGQYCEVDAIYLPVANYSPIGIYKNIKAAKKSCKLKKYDIVHITGAEHYLLPFLRSENCIVTVHDIMYYDSLSGLKRWVWQRLFIDSLKFAKRVTFISEYSKCQLDKLLRLDKSRVSVIPNSYSPDFKYHPKRINDKPIILHIGTFERKNLKRTIEAISGVNCQLRVVGNIGRDIVASLEKYNIEYTSVMNLCDNEILEEYINCDIVNFPSTYEGFGMPILEGQAVGRVVLTSNISPMKEVCGGAAILVDPFDASSIRDGYDQIIKSEELRNKMVNLGISNSKLYTVETIAKRYYEQYELMLKR